MSSIEKVESNSFEVGGYKWSLILYPNGNKKVDGEDYISMHLRMAATSSLPCGWEVNLSFRFFVFDHIRDKYLILGDMGGSTRRFHGARPEWGFSKLLPLTTLNDPLSGFVVDDTCVFGAEVLVCKCTGNGDCLSMLSKPTTGSYKWDIGRFSEQKEHLVSSDKFVAGDQEWYLCVCPKGDANENNKGLPVYLFLAEWKTLTPALRVYAECKFRVRNQIGNEHKEYQDVFCFTDEMLGTSKLIGLAELNDKTKGFVVNDKEALVESLYLGRSPPMFTEMRVLGESTGDDHLVMELGMNFLAADDMSAIIAVKLRKRLGFGMWAKLHMTGMHVEGKVIVGVKFLREWPFLGRLRVCFSEPPYFQMTVKPIFNHGIDVTEIPGIAGWIDNLLAVAFEQTLVEPNMLVVDVEKFVSSPKEKWFSVDEKDPVALAVVEIIEAEDMKPSDLNGFADPYVKGQVGTFKFRTKVQKKTLAPKWNEEFKIPICTWETLNLLTLEVCDKDHLFDDTLGKCSININELRGEPRRSFWLPLQNIKMGSLHLAVTVLDAERKVDVHDVEQTNEKKNANSISRESSQRKGSTATISSGQVPKVVDDFEPINVEGQQQTGIWVHHPGSDITQTRETRKGKPRHSGIKIQRENNNSLTKNGQQSAAPVSNYSGESSSADESQKVHKSKPLGAIQIGLKKVGSMFHRSPRSPKSPRSPRSPRTGDSNFTEESKVNDDISGPLDGSIADKEITSPQVDSPHQSTKRGVARSIAQKVEKSAHSLKKAVTRKVSHKSNPDSAPTNIENSQETSSCSEESRSSSAVDTPRTDSLVGSLPSSFQVEKYVDTEEQNNNHASIKDPLVSGEEPQVSEVTFPGFAKADKTYSSMNSDAYGEKEVEKSLNSKLPDAYGENEVEKAVNSKLPDTENGLSETDKAKLDSL